MPFDGTSIPQQILAPRGAIVRAWDATRNLARRGFPAISALSRVDRPDTSPALLLRAARSMIMREDNWIRGHFHRPNRRYCAVGAIRAAARQLHARESLPVALGLLRQVAKVRGFDTIERMNDASTHAEVLTSFDLAIGAADALQTA